MDRQQTQLNYYYYTKLAANVREISKNKIIKKNIFFALDRCLLRLFTFSREHLHTSRAHMDTKCALVWFGMRILSSSLFFAQFFLSFS